MGSEIGKITVVQRGEVHCLSVTRASAEQNGSRLAFLRAPWRSRSHPGSRLPQGQGSELGRTSFLDSLPLEAVVFLFFCVGKRRPGTGLEQWFGGDFVVQTILCASLAEQRAALAPSRQGVCPGPWQPGILREAAANDGKNTSRKD